MPHGASRLDLVLTWDEPPADTISSAVLNDLDLWLDHGADCGTEPCGEHASASRVDNVEWIIVRHPAPGTHRAKVAASRIYTEAPRAALAWTVVRGSSTPDLEISVDRELLEVENLGDHKELTLSLAADGYVAAGTRLHLDCRGVDGTRCDSSGNVRISAEREGGVIRQVDAWVGESFEVGELGAGETWQATVRLRNLAEAGTDAFRLYFKASAWNANAASASVLVRRKGAGGKGVPEVSAPVNDRFENAISIEGSRGSAQIDLIRAVAEPGEPVFTARHGRPAGSVWYSWTAPSHDKVSLVSFGVTPDGAVGHRDEARVDVFRGDRIAGLESVGSGEWGTQFFADAGEVYLIRVSHAGGAVPLMLNWSAGPRPVNDDLAAATVLEGAGGSVEGTNAGATLEPGEFFGHLAASVWYRWTAPGDGSWKFESGAADLRVLAFTGERVSDLRLVSAFPAAQAVFPARGGDAYWIAVASLGAYADGGAFELTWDNHDREPGNDDFGGAEQIPGAASSSHRVDIDSEATVEPGEPLGSGIRTKWWTWTAPADGRHVWRIDELTRPTTGPNNRLMVSVFQGEALDDLEPVATNGERMAVEFAFEAIGGQRYWMSAGLPKGDLWAFHSAYATLDATLVWGAAPENDEAAGAVALAGTSGSVSGSNAFATNAYGERSVDVGRSTLWYAWAAPAAGVFRFAVDGIGGPWVLTVYRDSADGNGLDAVASDRTDGTVAFEASAGVRYMVVLGLGRGGRGGDFTLRWEQADPSPPRYVGRLADGDRDSRDNPVEIRQPGALAMHPDGTALYLASGLGLQVFERDGPTGRLDHAQLIEPDYPWSRRDVALLWDPGRDRLLADNCQAGHFHAFAPVGAGPELEDLGRVPGHPGSCPVSVLLIDPSGSDLYRIVYGGKRLAHFAVSEDGAIRKVADYVLPRGPTPGDEWAAAVLSNDGRHVYVATGNLLQVFQRDPETGTLARSDHEGLIARSTDSPLAITDDDSHLFVLEDHDSTTVFSLQDRMNPQKLATLERSSGSVNSWRPATCRFADVRPESLTVDVFCDDLAFAVRWDAGSGELKGTDWIRPLPEPDFADPVGFAVSPDGRHLYVVTWSDGLVTFVRDGVDGNDAGGSGGWYCRDGDEAESRTDCAVIHDTPR